jgi:D-amino peptidase
MRVYMFCDQEGTAGMVFQDNFSDDNWHDKDTWNAMQRRRIQELQTAEVQAGCDGLVEAGATEIVINDAHGGGYNILFERLTGPIRMIHGNPRRGEFWMSRLDDSFDAHCYLGGHPMGGTQQGILPHTNWTVNDEIRLGEVGMAMSLAGWFGVPTVAVSGDRATEKEVHDLVPEVEFAVVKEAFAPDIAIEHIPANARTMIRDACRKGLERVKEIPPLRFAGPPYRVKYGGMGAEGDDYYECVYDALMRGGLQYGKKWVRNRNREWVELEEQA